jgi:hypothetical protein
VNMYTSNAVVVSLSSTCLVWCLSFLYINPNRVKKKKKKKELAWMSTVNSYLLLDACLD